MVVLNELPSEERLEKLLWDRGQKPWNIIIRRSFGLPQPCALGVTFSGKNLQRDQLDDFFVGCVGAHVRNLLKNNSQKIIAITLLDETNSVHVHVPLSGS